jgi:hypothetical protein
MKQTGKIFRTDDVKAILEDRKTVFRIPVKPQPPEDAALVKFNKKNINVPEVDVPELIGKVSWFEEEAGDLWPCDRKDAIPCPFGQIGDKIYVRETFMHADYNSTLHDPESFTFYKADNWSKEDFQKWQNSNSKIPPDKWKPSIHMPKKYSRLWLEITDIRVERVQDITGEDSIKEGIFETGGLFRGAKKENGCRSGWSSAINAFSSIWDSIYNNWSSNPWVWVIEFKKIKKEN